MKDRFNPVWNPHYDFDNPMNQKEIEAVEHYRLDADQGDYATGDVINSPWGSNQVVEAKNEDGVDICIKKIVVKPGFMLSLQRHRGRQELWEVTDGVLTVVLNGARHEVPAGQSIEMPLGAVHCMINASETPVTVIETQKGVTREKDNIRLVDFSNRPTYPLTSEIEFASAKLYAAIQQEIAEKFGTQNLPSKALLAA